jgi:hypothetical protein
MVASSPFLMRTTASREACSFGSLLGMENPELAQVDPLAINLHVARGIPQLSHLKIEDYQSLADDWAAGVRRLIGELEHHFYRQPGDFKNDLSFFRLGVLCQYVAINLGIGYIEEQKEQNETKEFRYTEFQKMGCCKVPSYLEGPLRDFQAKLKN